MKARDLLDALAVKFKAETGVKVTLEPDPVDYGYDPTLRITPADWEWDSVMSPKQVTLKVSASLEVSGEDAGLYLSDAMEAHLKTVLWLDAPEIWMLVGGHRVVITGEVQPGPAIQKNEEEGKKPFMYQKTFDLGLRLDLRALKS